MTPELITLAIKDIVIGERFRKDVGDITGLAASIDKIGQLQPVGVTADNVLVFGERRLRALQYLGQRTVLARVVNLTSMIEGEYAENECRQAFTPTERAAIAKAMQDETGNRQGQRTDRQLPGNCAEVQKGIETREVVARRAGFANATEHERVQKVIDQGTPELVEAMDAGAVSISAAAEVAALPPEEQQAAVAAGPKAVTAAAKTVREKKKAKPAANQDAGNPAWNAALADELDNLRDVLSEAMADKEKVSAEKDALAKLLAADDQVAAALAQVKHYRELADVIMSQLNACMEEKNALIRMAKGYKLRAERAERELDTLRKQMPAAA
jgi:ParB-like chromosome segregation protein Spo0J